MRYLHPRSTTALLAGLVTLAACDTSRDLLGPQPEHAAPRRAWAEVPFEGAAFYSFDHDAGNGTVSGAVHQAAAGHEGGAYYFDGQGAFIDLPIDVNPESLPQLTMGAWVRPQSVPAGGIPAQVLSHDDGGFDRTLGLDPRGPGWSIIDGKYRFSAFNGSGVLNGPVASTGAWTFVAAVYDQGTVTLYVNGQQTTSEEMTGYGLSELRVGGNPAGSPTGEPFHGWIDNVFVMDRALEASEIAGIRIGGACVLAETPCDAITRITRLVTIAAEDGEITQRQARQVNGRLNAVAVVLTRADATPKPTKKAAILRNALLHANEALALLPTGGAMTAQARTEILQLRADVQARLDAI